MNGVTWVSAEPLNNNTFLVGIPGLLRKRLAREAPGLEHSGRIYGRDWSCSRCYGWVEGRILRSIRLMRCPTGSQPQKGIVHYGLSANRQRPLAGTLNAAIFNTWRRFSHQVLYFAPPLVIAYYSMQWAIERLVFLTANLPISHHIIS